mgnify:CR=1 FL=1
MPILTKLTRNEVKMEIVKSIEMIESELKIRPQIFAYPNGQGSDIPDYSYNLLDELIQKQTQHMPEHVKARYLN